MPTTPAMPPLPTTFQPCMLSSLLALSALLALLALPALLALFIVAYA